MTTPNTGAAPETSTWQQARVAIANQSKSELEAVWSRLPNEGKREALALILHPFQHALQPWLVDQLSYWKSSQHPDTAMLQAIDDLLRPSYPHHWFLDLLKPGDQDYIRDALWTAINRGDWQRVDTLWSERQVPPSTGIGFLYALVRLPRTDPAQRWLQHLDQSGCLTPEVLEQAQNHAIRVERHGQLAWLLHTSEATFLSVVQTALLKQDATALDLLQQRSTFRADALMEAFHQRITRFQKAQRHRMAVTVRGTEDESREAMDRLGCLGTFEQRETWLKRYANHALPLTTELHCAQTRERQIQRLDATAPSTRARPRS